MGYQGEAVASHSFFFLHNKKLRMERADQRQKKSSRLRHGHRHSFLPEASTWLLTLRHHFVLKEGGFVLTQRFYHVR